MDKLPRYISLRLGIVALLLATCVVIRPEGLAANNGFSYFGDHKTTVVPYSLAFILYAFYLWKLSEITGFMELRLRTLSVLLRIMAVMVIGLLITPSDLIDSVHVVFGTILFGLQFLVAIWFAGWWQRSWLTIGLAALVLVGGLMSFYFLLKPHGLLLQGQTIFLLAFSALLVVILAGTEIPPGDG